MSGRATAIARVMILCALAAPLAGCINYDGVVQRGYQVDPQALAQVHNGESKEKVLSVLGTPSTTSTIGGDAWYYISQKVERKVAFMNASVTEQRVLAVYFAGNKVTRIANYGLQDGRVFDYVSRTTPVAGGDTGFIQNMLTNLLKFG
ncbi:MAG: outer membrane protein assembly factor BamE [Hyphomicrobiales bacterium]|nr:outer membrane protein assembly factor BamE [Hyphomicrobiales bacterium]